MAGQPPYADPAAWNVNYTITNSSDGSPITGVPAMDPLTGTVIVSHSDIIIEGPALATEAEVTVTSEATVSSVEVANLSATTKISILNR
jgi:hypothetical protein